MVDNPPPAVVAAPEPDAELALPEREARRIDLFWSAGMVGSLAFLFLVLSLFRGVGIPVMLALGIAYALNPIVSWIEKKGYKRTLATAAVFAALALLLAGFVLYLIPVVIDEAAKLPDFFQKASTRLAPWLQETLGFNAPDWLRTRIAELGGDVSKLIAGSGANLAKIASAVAGSTGSFIARLIGLLVVPVLGFFFLRDYPRLTAMGKDMLPRRAAALLGKRFSEIDDVLSAFVRGQLTVGAILSVIYSAGLSIARVDMAIVIGLIAGFGNMVPYVGTAVGLTLAMVAVMLSWQGPWQLAVIAGTFVLAQASEGLVITPRVVGQKVGLPPVAVIIAVLGFGELFGFVGVLLAVPTAAILKVVLRVIVQRYKRTKLFTGEAA